MRKILASWLLVIIMAFQFVNIPEVSGAQQQIVNILFTHDMHGNFLPVNSMQDGVVKKLGGYARLQSAINDLKGSDENYILVDAGDFSMGTPFQTIFSSDSPELRILGKMGYDVVTLGNHEFDYRADGLAESLEAAIKSGDKLPAIVQANMIFPEDKEGKMTDSLAKLKKSLEDYGLKDYVVLNRNGVKIGVFGLMGKESASMAPMSEVEFEDAVKHAKRVVKILKEQEKVDLIVCLSHSGTSSKKSESEDEILAKKVPDINVIISGHTHTKLTQPIMAGKTVIGSCEEYGRNLGSIKMIRKEDGDWELVGYSLRPIDDSLSEDPEISDIIKQYKDIVQEKYFDHFNLKYDDVVATSPYNFQTVEEIGKNHDESTLGNLISDSYIYAVKKAEGDAYIPIAAAIVPMGTIRGTFFKGDITAADAFSVSSLGLGADKSPGYPLISVYLTGKELKTVCEVDASITPIMGVAQLFISGMKYTFNPNRVIFNKVTKCSLLNPDGSEEQIEDKRLYRVVAGLYSAQMLSVVGDKSFGLLSIVPKDKDGNPITDFEAHIIYDTSGDEKREVKEWSAIVDYLRSFEKVDGVSQIPEYYAEPQGRKVVDDNANIFAILSNPNGIAIAIYIIVIVLCLVLILVIRKIIKKSRR